MSSGVTLKELMLIPGLSGHEDRVRSHIRKELDGLDLSLETDRFGNLIATLPGTATDAPSVMLIAHMDQIGFFVRRIEPDGLIRVTRLGGIPDKVLPSTKVLLCVEGGKDLPAVFGVKSNHVTPESEKLKLQDHTEMYVDGGFESADAVTAAGVKIGTPVVYAPSHTELAGSRVCGTSIDDRAACAVLIAAAKELANSVSHPEVHFVFSVQEEFNVRGAYVAAQKLRPDIAIQVDVAIATDTADLVSLGDTRLGGGPVISLYNFHGRGTLNGLIPHPALVKHFEETAARNDLAVQRAAIVGGLTDNAYVQFAGDGVACIDLGLPARYVHSPNEMCDLRDLEALTRLLTTALGELDEEFSLAREQE